MRWLFGIFLFFLLVSLPFQEGRSFSLNERVHEYRLKNGFVLIVVPRKQAPVASFALCYRVGAVDETSGASGTAHLLEHMLFKGTQTIGTKNYTAERKLLQQIWDIGVTLDEIEKTGNPSDEKKKEELRRKLESLQNEHNNIIIDNEIDAIYSRNGAEDLNAGTGFDVTTYTVSLPSNRLELWARIESDRFSNPVFRQFFIERNVVLEELRQSYESRPDRLLMTHVLSTAFFAHPYGRPIIGWPSDIRFLSPYVCQSFFKTHYTPDKAVAAIVGDIDPEAAFSIVKKYFGHLASSNLQPKTVTEEPEQKGERRVVVEAQAEPLLVVAFHKPTLPHVDDTVFDVIEFLLTGGRSSRLYKKLVIDLQLATSVSSTNGFPGSRYPNLFLIQVIPRHGISYLTVEKALYDELDRLAHTEISSDELSSAKKQLKADFIRRMQSNDELAQLLSYYQSIAGDWRYIEENFRRMDDITLNNVRSVAQRYFTQANRTVGLLMRPGTNER